MIWILWLIFTVLFLFLSIDHYLASRKTFEKYKRDFGIAGSINSIPTGIPEFERHLNSYIDSMNNANNRNHKLSSLGYFIAGLTSAVSLFFSLFS
jgi:hypothetical protein